MAVVSRSSEPSGFRSPKCPASAPVFGERSQEGVFMFSENILLPRGKGLVGRKVSCFGMFFDLETGLGLLEGQSPGDPT